MRWLSQHMLGIVVGALLTLILANTALVYLHNQVYAANRTVATQVDATSSALNATLSALQDAETGQRGYLLTGETEYLAPYTAAIHRLPALLAQLQQLAVDQPAQQPHIATLQRETQIKVAELEQTIALRRKHGLAPAQQIVLTDLGRQQMDTIRAEIATMQLTARAEHDALNSAAQRLSQISALRFVLTNGAIVVLLVLIYTCVSTERRKQTDQLQATTTLQRAILDGANYAIIGTAPDGTITLFNAAAERWLGYRAADLVGHASLTTLHDPAELTRRAATFADQLDPMLPAPFAALVALAQHNQTDEHEWTYLRHNGSRLPVRVSLTSLHDNSGVVIGFLSVASDVSALKRADAERAAREEAQAARAAAEEEQRRLAFLGEASTRLINTTDYEARLQTVVRLVVPTLADWCAISLIQTDQRIERMAVFQTEAVRQMPSATRHELSEAVLHPLVTDVIRSDRPRLLVHSAGDDHAGLPWALLRASSITALLLVPLHIHERTIGVMTCALVGSDRSYTAADLALAQGVARRAAPAIENARLYRETQEALERREAFLSITAHELKTPLTSMLGYAHVLERRVATQQAWRERDRVSIQAIMDEGHKLNTLIDELLDVSRIELGRLSIQRRSIDLCALIQRVADHFQPTLERHTLTLHLPADELIVSGDELRLEQVLHNLLQNAIKYSPHGGPIEILVGTNDQQVQLSVRDFGIGIPLKDQANLFHRFYRANNVDEQGIAGLGIGLYIVHELVTLHDGLISVESAEGEGSTFTISLPLLDPSYALPHEPVLTP